MEASTRELIEVLIALSPWVAFLLAVIWSTIHDRSIERGAVGDYSDSRPPRG